MKKIFLLSIFSLLLFKVFSPHAFAQSEITEKISKPETLEAVVVSVLEEEITRPKFAQEDQLYQKLELLVTKGTLKDKKIIVENGNLSVANNLKYLDNDKVLVVYSKTPDGKDNFYISDYIRRDGLLLLFLLFVVFTAAIAKKRGILSLVGMGISFLVIFTFILPRIINGANPVTIAVLGSLVIIPVTFFLSHGFNKKTLVAIAGTAVALIATGILADTFITASKLTGFATEEAAFLEVARKGAVNMKGLLLAGIIIGVLGVLDDITISQSAIVFQLKQANNKLRFRELYKRAMNVGQDHISSMVNTLILVYTGASLPLLLLFLDSTRSFSEVINYELIADEIVRTLVGSIGLILAVPITTLIAAFIAGKEA